MYHMEEIVRLFLKKLRIQLWWNHIIPPIIASIYFVIWYADFYEPILWLNILLFISFLFGCAGFGYFINDVFDIEVDYLAGKSNSASGIGMIAMLTIGCGLLFIGLVPWIWLPHGIFSIGLVSLLIMCLVIYSVPPMRFKERGFLGLICDVHYGHIFPVFIAVNTFGVIYAVQWPSGFFHGTLLYFLLFTKGLRNILCHQVADIHNDRIAGIDTFTTSLGIQKISSHINLVLAIEFILLILLLTSHSAILLLSFVIFILVNTILVISWDTFKLKVDERFTKLWFILNDFYEEWLPFFLLMMVVVKYPRLWWLLPLHVLLFRQSIVNMILDISDMIKWFYLMARKYIF
jgi:4-hydroxybenzoate polyprenyltransferase